MLDIRTRMVYRSKVTWVAMHWRQSLEIWN